MGAPWRRRAPAARTRRPRATWPIPTPAGIPQAPPSRTGAAANRSRPARGRGVIAVASVVAIVFAVKGSGGTGRAASQQHRPRRRPTRRSYRQPPTVEPTAAADRRATRRSAAQRQQRRATAAAVPARTRAVTIRSAQRRQAKPYDGPELPDGRASYKRPRSAQGGRAAASLALHRQGRQPELKCRHDGGCYRQPADQSRFAAPPRSTPGIAPRTRPRRPRRAAPRPRRGAASASPRRRIARRRRGAW